MGVQRRTVPHFKSWICAKVELETQGRDSTFTICHTQLKKAILHPKTGNGRIFFRLSVNTSDASEPRLGSVSARALDQKARLGSYDFSKSSVY